MSSQTRERPDVSELEIREAANRYLRRRQPDATDKSIDGWKYRLKLFADWGESVGIDTVGEIQRYDIDEYYEERSSEVKPVTLEGEMWTLQTFLEFLEDLDAVDDGLSDAVRIPDLDPMERASDKKLATDDALALLQYYRNSEDEYGTRNHAYLELAWFTGARQGGLRALDLRDTHLDEDPWLEFRHRPESGTGLKNKLGGERPVALTNEIRDVLRTYISEYRHDVRDDHGRQPLLASKVGRPTSNTLRNWSYIATQPCLHGPCPHGKERVACSWTDYHAASKCPSSRAPHHVRTGAITWMLNRGWPPEDVAERVNATVETIETHYDKADLDERRNRLRDRMEQRRRPLLDSLDLTEG
jgi:site-specific recombinase XerD